MRLQTKCFWKPNKEQSFFFRLSTHTESRFKTQIQGGCDSQCTLRQSWREHRHFESDAAALFFLSHPLEKHTKQLSASTISRLCLFRWPLLPEVKQLFRARHPDTWMESCPFHWQTHTLRHFCSVSFSLSCPVSFFSIPHLFFLETHTQELTACLLFCFSEETLRWLDPTSNFNLLKLFACHHVTNNLPTFFQATPDHWSFQNKRNKSVHPSYRLRVPPFSFCSLFNK